MKKKYIIGLDTGTTSCRTIIFDKKLNIISQAKKEIPQYFPKENYVEQDANEIWGTQLSTIIQAIQQKGINVNEIDSIGICNQRETVVCWNKETGEPVYKAIVWQDRRTKDLCDFLSSDDVLQAKITEKTGLIINPYFSATKIKWILDNVSEAKTLLKQNKLIFGTIDSWLIYKLTGGKQHYTDVSNAARTLLFNIKTLEWDEELLELFNIPKSILPTIKMSSDNFGKVIIPLLSDANIFINGVMGDQQAALFGQRTKIGQAKSTYGTGNFIIVNTGKKIVYSKKNLLTTIAWGIDGKITYALEGSVFTAGSALRWLKDTIHLIDEYEQIDYFFDKFKTTNGVIVVPYFSGSAAPEWNPNLKGIITGITNSTQKGDIIRAVCEGICFQLKDLLLIFEDDIGHKINLILIDGGITNSCKIMQFQADILGKRLYKRKIIEISALGTVFAAGLYTKFWTSENELNALVNTTKRYKPKMSQKEINNRYKEWQESVKLAIQWKKDI